MRHRHVINGNNSHVPLLQVWEEEGGGGAFKIGDTVGFVHGYRSLIEKGTCTCTKEWGEGTKSVNFLSIQCIYMYTVYAYN